MLIKCNCTHEYQDKQYGHGNRVANPMKTDPKEPKKHRCTVCGTIHTGKAEKVEGADADKKK